MRALTLLVLGTCFSAGTVFAQTAPPAPTEADRLFEEGRQLLEGGRAAEACPKFEASQKLDPARGTLINIGACYAATGRLIEALATYKDVEQQSLTANDQTRVEAARAQIAQLDRIIPHVTITVAAPVPGLVVELDGVAVPSSDWADHRRNPGQVAVRAHAAGFEDHSETVTVMADGATTTVQIPALVPLARPDPLETHPPPVTITTDPGASRRKLAYIVGGSGIALFGASTAMAFLAKSKHGDAQCSGEPLLCATQADSDLTKEARRLGNVATVVGAAGLVAIGAGVVLYFTAPKRETIVAPTVTPDGAGVALSGSF